MRFRRHMCYVRIIYGRGCVSCTGSNFFFLLVVCNSFTFEPAVARAISSDRRGRRMPARIRVIIP